MHTTTDDAVMIQRFQAVAEGTRFQIVELPTDGERCVCELQSVLDAARSRRSFHPEALKEAGVVSVFNRARKPESGR